MLDFSVLGFMIDWSFDMNENNKIINRFSRERTLIIKLMSYCFHDY